jgi:hypothetical protein
MGISAPCKMLSVSMNHPSAVVMLIGFTGISFGFIFPCSDFIHPFCNIQKNAQPVLLIWLSSFDMSLFFFPLHVTDTPSPKI